MTSFTVQARYIFFLQKDSFKRQSSEKWIGSRIIPYVHKYALHPHPNFSGESMFAV